MVHLATLTEGGTVGLQRSVWAGSRGSKGLTQVVLAGKEKRALEAAAQLTRSAEIPGATLF